MALTTSAITGRVPLPTDALPEWALLTFTLSAYDTQGVDIVPPAITHATLKDGSLASDFRLWRNTAGLRGTHYTVTASWTHRRWDGTNLSGKANLGKIQIGDKDTYTLAELLNSTPPSVPEIGWFQAASAAEVAEVKNLAVEAGAIRAQVAADADRAEAAAGTAAEAAPIAADAVRADLTNAVASQAARAEAARDDASAVAGIREFRDLPTLLANATLTYGSGAAQVQAGDIVRTRNEGFSYRVVVLGSADYDMETAGGVLLIVLPGADGWYNFDAWSPAKNGVTDDFPKLRKALNKDMGGSGLYRPTLPISISSGTYYISQPIELKRTTYIKGPGCVHAITSATFRFAPNIGGLTVNRHNTVNGGVETPTTSADGSVIHGIVLEGNGDGGFKEECPGIWLRGKAKLLDVRISGFQGHGLQVIGTSGAGGRNEGNSNYSTITNISVRNNGGWGVYVIGADVNACVFQLVDAAANGRGGIADRSFLGNTWIACHSAHNGLMSAPKNLPGQATIVSHGGTIYYATEGATEAQLVATEPGTSSAVWTIISPGAPSVVHPAWQVGQPVGTYFHGRPYYSDNANSKSLFLGCYVEGGQTPSYISPRSIAVGGFFGAIDGGALIGADRGSPELASLTVGSQGSTSTGYFGSLPASGTAFSFFNPSTENLTSQPWRLQTASGDWVMRQSNATARTAYTLTSERTALLMGTTVPQPYVMAFPRIGLGTGNGIRRISNGTAAPTVGAYARGDVIYNFAPAAGGKVGWVCTTGGDAGSTAVFKPFGAIDA